MKKEKYDRLNTKEYAKKWAYTRNPQYYNFDDVGGDCTSFVSQCIYAGCNVMNYTKNTGWYYNSINDRSPSWSSVESLYKFLISNKSVGPRANIVEKNNLGIGDIVQLSFDGIKFSHTLIVVNIEEDFSLNHIYVASHTYDSYNRKVSTYKFNSIRLIHINGIWKW